MGTIVNPMFCLRIAKKNQCKSMHFTYCYGSHCKTTAFFIRILMANALKLTRTQENPRCLWRQVSGFDPRDPREANENPKEPKRTRQEPRRTQENPRGPMISPTTGVGFWPQRTQENPREPKRTREDPREPDENPTEPKRTKEKPKRPQENRDCKTTDTRRRREP